MSLILNIDTALEKASVCLSKDGQALQLSFNESQRDHASWLHPCVASMIGSTGYRMNDLDAIAVSIGPGSYTGLRIGLSAAKGFCFALNIPLLAVNTLELIAFAVKEEAKELICPVIDARRMEVFTAIYDKKMIRKTEPAAVIVDEYSFGSWLNQHQLLFCGNGINKIQPLISSGNATYTTNSPDASHLAMISDSLFINKQFATLAYTEPFYLKEFYTTGKKS